MVGGDLMRVGRNFGVRVAVATNIGARTLPGDWRNNAEVIEMVRANG